MTLRSKSAGWVSAIALIVSSAAFADDYEIEEVKTLTLDASSLEKFVVDVSAGSLVIEGVEGISEIQVTAEIFANDSDYKLELTERSGRARLVTEVNNNNSSWGSWGDNKSSRIDLTVKMPSKMMLDLTDTSGSAKVMNINNDVKIDDGSGSLKIRNIGGNLEVDDGSGSMEIVKVGGDLEVVDGSGSLEVESVGGNTDIEDGSGSLRVEDVAGTLKVDDGSGRITVKNITGHVTISDGSGSINLDTLMNGLTILESGSGGLVMDNVEGDIQTR